MVFVIQEQAGKDLKDAQSFGELKTLLPAGQQIMWSTGAVTQKLRRLLSHFCDEDYLLLIGDPVAIGVATAVAAHWNQGRVKFLKWDRVEHKYFPVQMQLYGPKKGETNESFD